MFIKFCRYILKIKYLRIIAGPLKGYKWNTSYNYDYITGNFENKELNTFCSWLNSNTVLYDLGGNIGYYAFIANRYISTGTIYSFEPIPKNIEIFNEHLKLNKNKICFNNIELLPYAVSDKDREVIFSHNEITIEGNTYINSSSTHTNAQKTIKVKAYSIDSLVNLGYKIPDVIKIDVEGAELDVLHGAVETLQKYKPKILLSTHDFHLPGVQQHCVDFLKEHNYELVHLDTRNKIIPGLDDYIAIPKIKTF